VHTLEVMFSISSPSSSSNFYTAGAEVIDRLEHVSMGTCCDLYRDRDLIRRGRYLDPKYVAMFQHYFAAWEVAQLTNKKCAYCLGVRRIALYNLSVFLSLLGIKGNGYKRD
jgi:hypothetical protein